MGLRGRVNGRKKARYEGLATGGLESHAHVSFGEQQRRRTRRTGPAGSAVALRNSHVLISGPCDRPPYMAKGTADVINSKDYEREEHSGISVWTHFHRMHP